MTNHAVEKKILVIAESRLVFELNFKDKTKYKYLPRIPDDIRGEANTTLILFGRYWRSPHWEEVAGRLKGYCESHNIKLSLIEEDVK